MDMEFDLDKDADVKLDSLGEGRHVVLFKHAEKFQGHTIGLSIKFVWRILNSDAPDRIDGSDYVTIIGYLDDTRHVMYGARLRDVANACRAIAGDIHETANEAAAAVLRGDFDGSSKVCVVGAPYETKSKKAFTTYKYAPCPQE